MNNQIARKVLCFTFNYYARKIVLVYFQAITMIYTTCQKQSSKNTVFYHEFPWKNIHYRYLTKKKKKKIMRFQHKWIIIMLLWTQLQKHIPSNLHWIPYFNTILCLFSTATDPLLWSKEDVECWLRWCIKEFALSNLDPKSFSMNGKALCLLPKDSFRLRTRESGDVLFEILQKLIFYNSK